MRHEKGDAARDRKANPAPLADEPGILHSSVWARSLAAVIDGLLNRTVFRAHVDIALAGVIRGRKGVLTDCAQMKI